MSISWIKAAMKSENEPFAATETELLACRGCLSTKIALHNLHSKGFAQLFGEFTGAAVLQNDGYPQHVCDMCLSYLRKFYNFRMRCHTAMYMLQQLQSQNQPLKPDTISSIDESHLKPNLTLVHVVFTNYPELAEDTENRLTKSEISSIKVYGSNMFGPEECTVEVSTTAKRKRSKRKKSSSVTKEIDLEVLEKKYDTKEKDTIILGKNKDIIKEETQSVTNNETLVEHEVDDILEDSNSVDEQGVLFKNSVVVLTKIEDEEELKDVEAKLKEINKKVNLRSKYALKTKPSLKRVKAEKESMVNDINSDKLSKVKNMTDDIDKLNKRSLKLNMRRAKKFSKAYNIEVIFLTKAQQLQEIEDRKNKSTESTFRCHLCHKWFTLELTYQRHMACHDPTKPVECEICKYRFSTRHKYLNHFNGLHVLKFICKVCGVINRKWAQAKRHSDYHRGASVACELCDKTFSEQKLYMMHLRSVHGPGPGAAKCPLCEDVFRGRAGVQMHLNKAHKQNKRCEVCSTVFADDTVLQRHLDSSVDNKCDPSKHPCSFCAVIFDSESMMQQHYDALHKKEFKCTQCDKSFARSQLLMAHMRTHIGANKRKYTQPHVNKKFMCEVCGKGNFRCRALLQYHQRLHSGERPYACAACGKAFISNASLVVHMTTHTDERKYKCSICSKAFHQLGHRTSHMLTHTKERPHACTLCPKRYAGSGSLKDHINVAHKGLPPARRKKKKTLEEED